MAEGDDPYAASFLESAREYLRTGPSPDVEFVARSVYVVRLFRHEALLDKFDDWPPEYRVPYYREAEAAIAAVTALGWRKVADAD